MLRFLLLLIAVSLPVLPAEMHVDGSEDQLDEVAIEAQVSHAVENLEAAITKVRLAQTQVEQGMMARWALTPMLEDLDRARKAVDEAEMRRQRLAYLKAVAQAEELAAREEPAQEEGAVYVSSVGEKFVGSGNFNIGALGRIQADFQEKFGKSMPVSALGQTSVHRSMGFNHRNRADIGLAPDSEEGLWLRKYLQANGIPYLAFRMAVRGQATAPHIHVGPPSVRLAR